MKLLYGTGNSGKLQHMKDMLSGLDFEIIGLNELDLYISHIDNYDRNENKSKLARGFRDFFKRAIIK